MTVHAPGAIVVLGQSGGRQVMTTNPSVDPTAGGGVAAPTGSLYLRDNGVIYTKVAAPSTSWSPVGSGGSEWASGILWPQPFTTGAGGVRNYGAAVGGAVYFGRAPRDIVAESFTAYYRTTTAWVPGAAPNWAEIAIATGAPSTAPTLTAVQFVDASAASPAGFAGATGPKATVISGVSMNEGDDFWLIFSWQIGAAGTGAVWRGLSVVDDLQTGVYQTRAAYQPSANIGVPLAFTLDTGGPIWCALGVP